jgi:hypothetical protein
MSLGPPSGDGSVHGTIESDRYEAVGGVRIEIPAENVVAWSDSTGAYQIKGLEPGEYKIRFSQFGYHPLELQITVPHDGSLSLDVRLRTRFIVFPEISALAYASVLDPGEVFEPSGLPEIGSRVLAGEALWSDPLARQPDVFEILSIIPGIDMAEESPTQLHVRGGSGDQNLVLLALRSPQMRYLRWRSTPACSRRGTVADCRALSTSRRRHRARMGCGSRVVRVWPMSG